MPRGEETGEETAASDSYLPGSNMVSSCYSQVPGQDKERPSFISFRGKGKYIVGVMAKLTISKDIKIHVLSMYH